MGTPFPGPWTWKHHPWLKGMHESVAPLNIGQKSAQGGFTETAINITFYKIDIERQSCLYVLPSKTPDATDFSASRFDTALELSPYLKNLFSDVQNVGHKRAGSANLFIRGSRVRAALKSIPVAFYVLDELDEMTQENVPLVHERMAGQVNKQGWEISTPTIPSYGINEKFEKSSKEHFFFSCPHCSKMIQLTFPESMVIMGESHLDLKHRQSYLICTECKNKLDHETKTDWLKDGVWVPANPDEKHIRGFYVNQLYSSTVSPAELAESFHMSKINAATETEFWNSKLGLPHTVADARVTLAQVEACIAPYDKVRNSHGIKKLITMGVDVGKRLHINIDAWDVPKNCPLADINSHCKPNVIWQGTRPDFEQLDSLMREFIVDFCVLDANPERRKAFEFASRFWGRVYMCLYGKSEVSRMVTITPGVEKCITVNRTSWLDLRQGRFHHGWQHQCGIALPRDLDFEYKSNITQLIRVYRQDKDEDGGGVIAEYQRVGDDHYAHAGTYSEIALQFAAGAGQTIEIRSPV